jgi:hypothetical protein
MDSVLLPTNTILTPGQCYSIVTYSTQGTCDTVNTNLQHLLYPLGLDVLQ